MPYTMYYNVRYFRWIPPEALSQSELGASEAIFDYVIFWGAGEAIWVNCFSCSRSKGSSRKNCFARFPASQGAQKQCSGGLLITPGLAGLADIVDINIADPDVGKSCENGVYQQIEACEYRDQDNNVKNCFTYAPQSTQSNLLFIERNAY